MVLSAFDETLHEPLLIVPFSKLFQSCCSLQSQTKTLKESSAAGFISLPLDVVFSLLFLRSSLCSLYLPLFRIFVYLSSSLLPLTFLSEHDSPHSPAQLGILEVHKTVLWERIKTWAITFKVSTCIQNVRTMVKKKEKQSRGVQRK